VQATVVIREFCQSVVAQFFNERGGLLGFQTVDYRAGLPKVIDNRAPRPMKPNLLPKEI
jgi:hypothetical protein